MELKRITRKSPDFKGIRKTYLSSFPNEERAPFWLLQWKTRKPCTDFWGLYEKNRCVGMAYMVCDETVAYVFYFAIHQSERGKGYGTKAIQTLTEYYHDKKFFLALERLDQSAKNYDERLKRHNFYKRAGLTELPYHIKEATVTYDIMGVGGTIEPEEYANVIRQFMGERQMQRFDMRILK